MREEVVKEFTGPDGVTMFRAYHGTDLTSAESILQNGFNVGTYFAFQCEVAERFGNCVFTVEFLREGLNDSSFESEEEWWQFHTLHAIPASAVIELKKLGTEAEQRKRKWSWDYEAITEGDGNDEHGDSRTHVDQ